MTDSESVMEDAFGSELTVGIEEELLLVDRETRRLTPVAAEVLARMGADPGAASHEAYAAQIELRSPPSRTAAEAAASLRRARASARAAGATLLGAGLHPTAAQDGIEIVDEERYRRVARAMRGLFGRTPESALHVHVGMPDREAAIRAFQALREELPLLQGLTASSPWWFGRDSGMASARYALVRAYPGRGVPPAFDDFEAYERHVEQAIAAAEVDDYTLLWWDIRPHPRLGTIEVREMDAQASLDAAAAVAALIQAVAATAVDAPSQAVPSPSEALAWSCFRAARDGLDAAVLHDGAMTPLREVARDTLGRVRPAARSLGCEDGLEGVERILREGGAAERQRAAHARGGLDALLDHLVEETARV
ncbi:MAG: YbdK family carboxylate-amine ligase [Actinobacteria bacterium]|nr:YbdK family carboxylate-amine ligase [Actinomycetota bacterium]